MMQNSAYNLSMVFEQTADWDFAEVTLTSRMIRTLAIVNGKTSVAQLCEALDETYADLFSDLQNLHELRLIKLAPPPATQQAKKAPRIKRGYYRGAGFEVTVDENSNVVPSHNI